MQLKLAFSLASMQHLQLDWTEVQDLWETPDVQLFLERWNQLFDKCEQYKMVKGSRGTALLLSLMSAQNRDRLPGLRQPLILQHWISPFMSHAEAFKNNH